MIQSSVPQSTVQMQFLQMIKNGLSKEYRDMSSNPLLLLIMYVTFADSGKLSSTQHEFFEDAFNALWLKHDIRKDGFERSRFTSLERSDFLRIVAAFAMFSYVDSDFDIGHSRFSSHFENAKKYSGIAVGEDAFRKDMLVSTSLMVEEGRTIKFIHRSFQEYFASCFISKLPQEHFAKVIKSIFSRQEADQVLYFLLSHSKQLFERNWVLPQLKIIQNMNLVNSTSQSKIKLFDQRNSEDTIQVSYVKTFIRNIYNFSPTTEELNVALDIAQEIQNERDQLVMLSQDVEAFILSDEENFLRLYEQIEKESSLSDSAVDLLLNGS